MATVNSELSPLSKTTHQAAWMKKSISNVNDLNQLLRPETEIEKSLLQDPEFQEGLLWGEPRFGHPEGKVALHVREILDNIDRLPVTVLQRSQLRLIAFVHDTFKYQEPKSFPRDWDQHHAVLARQFMERFTDDKVVLTIIELHDEAFYIWRRTFLRNQVEIGKAQLEALLDRLDDLLEMYYYFFHSDTRTGDKLQSPLFWFDQVVRKKGIQPIKE